MNLNGILLEKLPFPYFLVDDRFVIVSSSMEKGPFVSGSLFTNLCHREDLDQFYADFSQKNTFELKLSNGEDFQWHRVYKVPDNHGHIHLFCFPVDKDADELIKTAEGIEQKLIDYNRQLLERKIEVEKKLEDLNELILSSDCMTNASKLAAGIAHEIRNPLTTVKGFIQLLKPHLQEIGKEEYAEIALDELNRANDLIFEFLNTMKPQKQKTEVALNKIVKDIAMLYESEALLKNVQLSVMLAEKDPLIFADAKQIKQVLLNILKNAIESIDTTKEGRIQISVGIKEPYTAVIIEDNGCGMTEQTIENLFTPYFSTKQSGTGIGLSISRKIIKDHNGHINIFSTPGEGTIFTIELPLLKIGHEVNA